MAAGDPAPTGTTPNDMTPNDMTPNDSVPTGTPGPPTGPATRYCDRCGQPAGHTGAAVCARARTLEPPRYCAACRRRMVVQVTPTGWSARCAEHGVTASPSPRT